MIDSIHSSLHFLLAFALVAMLAAQNVLIRPKDHRVQPSSGCELGSSLWRECGVVARCGIQSRLLGHQGPSLLSVESPLLDQDRSLHDSGDTLDSADPTVNPMEHAGSPAN